MFEVCAAEAFNGSLLVAVKIFLGLPMNGSKAVIKVGTLMEVFDVFFVAREVFALDAEADVEPVFVGLFGALDDADVEVKFTLRHAHDLPKAIWHRAVAGENDAFET